MASSEAFTDCSLQLVGFLNSAPESAKGSQNVSYFYLDLLQDLVLICKFISGTPCLSFRIDLAKSSSFLVSIIRYFSFDLLDMLISFNNVAPCKGDTLEMLICKRKPLVLISYIWTILSQLPP